ncbi:hypothetical protein GGTG_12959 [Gaeumannomyces tritici R3-111a-1]|uniref:Uncharacterized protein n=1 Tax=Gaeumannomyces tritici (strain R3-111a-1) TaxID=644352 RepID=J3PHH9_GAET3|nr:hypothetical protein GGTG_12959 [Gaeumannomyces tritici R3-111a-1]EJT69340.1 hypothetical protein GGTG_12959 [Gaeumannomyces tritici R3-111a-1]
MPVEPITIISSDDEAPAPIMAPAPRPERRRLPNGPGLKGPSHRFSNTNGDVAGAPPAKRAKIGANGYSFATATTTVTTATTATTATAATPTKATTATVAPASTSSALLNNQPNTPAPSSLIIISSDEDDGKSDDDAQIAPTLAAPGAGPTPQDARLPISSWPRPRPQRGPYRMREADLAAPSLQPPTATYVPPPPATTPTRPAVHRKPQVTKSHKSRIQPTSPANFRARGRALQLQAATDPALHTSVFEGGRRPYLRRASRALLFKKKNRFENIPNGAIIHADLTVDEVDTVAQSLARGKGYQDIVAIAKGYGKALKEQKSEDKKEFIDETLKEIKLPGREPGDIANFLADVAKYRRWNRCPMAIAPDQDMLDQGNRCARNAKLFSFLASREALPLGSSTLVGADAVYRDVRNGIRSLIEDELELRLQWTNAAGDIITTSWVSNDAFICGATSHSDAHNQQYNKSGNLLLGSASQGTVHAYPDHRIPRPIVQGGSNASAEMVESQDPWLYSSVVFSDYDSRYNRAYTASFDHTVKVWNLTDRAMRLLGTWEHTGNVNYVLASKHPSGMVATAANAASDAVRIYSITDNNVSASNYRPFSAPLAEGAATEKWAYFPSTMRWGLSAGSLHLLLVGYSPRSLTGDDNDIPEDKRQSGELNLWDGLNGENWSVSSASKCNIFDVAWHPSQECFIAATSPTGTKENSTRTQIRVYSLAKDHRRTYSETKTLDCTAVDVNSLTIMPYCPKASYVTAGCTDGKTYVWDTGSQEALPFQILAHGPPIEEPEFGNVEIGDVGVLFQAWGSSPDRFYTGSSDGTVRVWNVRTEGKPLVRVLLECPGAVTSGAFSPDKTKLVIGDGTGRVFLLTTHDSEEDEWGGASDGTAKPTKNLGQPLSSSALPGQPMRIRTEDGGMLTRRRPTPIILHPEPPRPTHDAAGNPIAYETGVTLSRAFINAGQLEVRRSRVIGAVQGPNYDSTGLYCRDSRMDPNDRNSPLRFADAKQQQSALRKYSDVRGGNGGGADVAGSDAAARPRGEKARALATQRHERNRALDLDVDALDEQTRAQLGADVVALARDTDFDLVEVELPDEVLRDMAVWA